MTPTPTPDHRDLPRGPQMPGVPHRLHLRCTSCGEEMWARCLGDQGDAMLVQEATHEAFTDCLGRLEPAWPGIDNCDINALLTQLKRQAEARPAVAPEGK